MSGILDSYLGKGNTTIDMQNTNKKKIVDTLLRARDEGLYDAITDCGAGGFSSAVGEMGEETGAHVDLDKDDQFFAY